MTANTRSRFAFPNSQPNQQPEHADADACAVSSGGPAITVCLAPSPQPLPQRSSWFTPLM